MYIHICPIVSNFSYSYKDKSNGMVLPPPLGYSLVIF